MATMNDEQAAGAADRYLKMILEHQPGVFGNVSPFTGDDDRPKAVAKRIATFRQTLIEEFKKQEE